MARRDKLDIIKEMLILCQKGDLKKTKIANSLNLNFQKASEYLDWLVVHGMAQEGEKGTYKTTAAGDALLSNLRTLDGKTLESGAG
jgi:predicted transcriptional regulator